MRQRILGSVMVTLMVAGCGGGAPTAPVSNYAGGYTQAASTYGAMTQPDPYGGMTTAPAGTTGTYTSMAEAPVAMGDDYGMSPNYPAEEPVMAPEPQPPIYEPEAPLAAAPDPAPGLPVVNQSPDPTPEKQSIWSKIKNTAKSLVQKVKDKLTGDD